MAGGRRPRGEPTGYWFTGHWLAAAGAGAIETPAQRLVITSTYKQTLLQNPSGQSAHWHRQGNHQPGSADNQAERSAESLSHKDTMNMMANPHPPG